MVSFSATGGTERYYYGSLVIISAWKKKVLLMFLLFEQIDIRPALTEGGGDG